MPKKKTYTDRFRKKIVAEVLNRDIKNTAERNGLSEQEIETMFKDLGEDLITAKPQDLKRLGIDEIAMIKGQGNRRFKNEMHDSSRVDRKRIHAFP